MPRVARVVSLIAVVILSALSVTVAWADDPMQTDQMANGRAWTGWDDGWKLTYLRGYLDLTIYSALQTSDPKRYLLEHWAYKAVIGDYEKELDALFRDGENLRLPVPMAVEYCTIKLNGKLTKDQLEQMLISYRAKTARQ